MSLAHCLGCSKTKAGFPLGVQTPWDEGHKIEAMEQGLPKWLQVTVGAGVPLTMQSKRAVRPSTTSTSSSLRVKSGCTEGFTVSRALQVSSSARRARRGETLMARGRAEHMGQGTACHPMGAVGLRVHVQGIQAQCLGSAG